jgi:8-oxo-dGTP pyrophosphatase MutT (NUDIX family)
MLRLLKRLAAALVRRVPIVRSAIRLAVARWGKPGVAAVIVNDGRVLLFQHVFWTAARWGLPGGGIENGEDAETAIRREVREECGLEIEIVRRLGSTPGGGSTYFLCRPRGIEGASLPRLSFEILSAGWFHPDDLPRGVLAVHRRVIAGHSSGTLNA